MSRAGAWTLRLAWHASAVATRTVAALAGAVLAYNLVDALQGRLFRATNLQDDFRQLFQALAVAVAAGAVAALVLGWPARRFAWPVRLLHAAVALTLLCAVVRWVLRH